MPLASRIAFGRRDGGLASSRLRVSAFVVSVFVTLIIASLGSNAGQGLLLGSLFGAIFNGCALFGRQQLQILGAQSGRWIDGVISSTHALFLGGW